MKIVINKTVSAIYASKKLIIPGTNVLKDDEFDETAGDAKSFIENGDLVLKTSDKWTAEDKKEAVNNVTNRDNLNKLKELDRKLDVTAAEQKLDKFDEQLNKAK